MTAKAPTDVRRAAFFAAANSRRGAEWFAPAVEALKEQGIDLADERLFESNQDLTEAVRATGAPLVIVGGGDGTLSSVVQHIEGTGRTLGVMPFGTGNAFAKDLGIPANIKKAAEIIAAGKTAQVDVGIANGKMFLNVATLGLTTLIARELDSGLKKISSTAAYLLAVIRALQKIKPFDAILTIDGESHAFRTIQIVIGNGRFHAGSLMVAEEASLNAGKLQIYALTGTNKTALLKMAMRARSGKQSELDEVVTFAAQSAHLETTPSRSVTLDGEVSTQTPLQLKVLPKVLKVAVPTDWNSHSNAPP
jgi:diacylglycerol kinase (ATP)